MLEETNGVVRRRYFPNQSFSISPEKRGEHATEVHRIQEVSAHISHLKDDTVEYV